jgi:predicted RND superfamily exporter protein
MIKKIFLVLKSVISSALIAGYAFAASQQNNYGYIPPEQVEQKKGLMSSLHSSLEKLFGSSANTIMIVAVIVIAVLCFAMLRFAFRKFFIAIIIALVIFALIHFAGVKF